MKTRTVMSSIGAALLVAGAAGAQIHFAANEIVLSDVGIRPVNVKTEDLNGDTRPDFIISNRGPQNDPRTRGDVTVLLSGPSCGWSVQQVLENLQLSAPYAIALRDVNSDGDAELFIGDADGFNVFEFTALGNGAFNPIPQDFFGGSQILDIAMGLVDNDAIDDIITAPFSEGPLLGFLGFLRGTGGGSFEPVVGVHGGSLGPKRLELVDLANTGDLDVVVAGSDSGFNVLKGHGDGTFGPPTNFSLYWSAFGGRFAIGDLDNDSRPDIAIDHANIGGGGLVMSVLRNTSALGQIDFALAEPLVLNANPDWVSLADLDNDGFLDIVVTHVGFQSIDVSIMRNDGGTSFEAPVELTISDSTMQAQAPSLVDIDADGDIDLVVVIHPQDFSAQNTTPGRIVYFENLTLGISPADINVDGLVNGADLAALLANWGLCDPPPPASCPGDLNDDGDVDGVDLAFLLTNWTQPCNP